MYGEGLINIINKNSYNYIMDVQNGTVVIDMENGISKPCYNSGQCCCINIVIMPLENILIQLFNVYKRVGQSRKTTLNLN